MPRMQLHGDGMRRGISALFRDYVSIGGSVPVPVPVPGCLHERKFKTHDNNVHVFHPNILKLFGSDEAKPTSIKSV